MDRRGRVWARGVLALVMARRSADCTFDGQGNFTESLSIKFLQMRRTYAQCVVSGAAMRSLSVGQVLS